MDWLNGSYVYKIQRIETQILEVTIFTPPFTTFLVAMVLSMLEVILK